MAYDLSVLDNFFSDPFSPFTDSSSHDIYQTLQESLSATTNTNTLQENSVDGIANPIDNIASELLSSSSSSPPSHQLENLSLYYITNQSFSNASDHSDISATATATALEVLEVKTEEYQVPFETIAGFCNSVLLQGSVSTTTTTAAAANNNAVKLLQRSYSSNSFEDNKPSFLFQPPHHHHHLDSVLESPPNYWPSQVLDSPAHQMRRVCSTGDLQKMKTNQTRSVLSSSPLFTEGSFMEEPNFKVGRYSAEERKERIHRYRAKRTQRNFNKTIKYACRKTLADNRPRIRGRFARNDEAVEIPKTAMLNRYEDDDDLWIDGYHEEDDQEGSMGRAPFYSSYGGSTHPQYQYFSY